MLARDRPSRYGMGKAIGPSDAREGQALALRYGEGGWASDNREGQALALRGRDTHRDREVSPTGRHRDREGRADNLSLKSAFQAVKKRRA